MSKDIGINPDKARKIQDDGSEFKLPSASRDELRSMSREEWMEKYGEVLASEQYFERKDPNWAQNKSSWWYQEVGRAAEEPPLWMRNQVSSTYSQYFYPNTTFLSSLTRLVQLTLNIHPLVPLQWHIPDLDCPAGGDRSTTPLDQRPAKPLWAERMNLTGSKQGEQSATIYGHRQEYLPANKASARSMYERYQPAYQRIINEEIPDTSDPPDGRFWKSGVAQGVSTNPYEKRLAISGRRKPIVVGPRSISVVVDGEGHTLANVARDVAWLHPSVEFAGYTLEHPVYRHVNMRVQTAEGGAPAEQALSETLELTQALFKEIGGAMERDLEGEWEERKVRLEEEAKQRDKEARKRQRIRDEKMARWVRMNEGAEKWDKQLEIELFGKGISTDKEAGRS